MMERWKPFFLYHHAIRGPEGSEKTVKHHLEFALLQNVHIVTSALLSTPRTSLSCCFWCNSSCRPGSYISSGATWKSQIANENQWKSLRSLPQSHTASPNTGYRPSTSEQFCAVMISLARRDFHVEGVQDNRCALVRTVPILTSLISAK